MKAYIKESSSKSRKSLGEFSIFNKITVYVNNPLPQDVDIVEAIALLEQRLPESLEYDVEEVMIGSFAFLKTREVASVFENGTIYVSNEQDSIMTLVDDIVHEFAHSLEASYARALYADKKLAGEYVGKKDRLLVLLKQEGIDVADEWYSQTEFDENFDDFLFREVGYPVVTNLSMDLFPSAYAVTSLREYLAVGFEVFCTEEREMLKDQCPTLYQKLQELFNS